MIPTQIQFRGLTIETKPGLCPPSVFTEAHVIMLEGLLSTMNLTRCLDLGTGTGVLALSLWHQDRSWCCVDLDPDALESVTLNSQRLDRTITTQLSDWFDRVQGRWDFIVANPPYTSQSDWDAAPEYHDLLKPMAVVGGVTGLECFDRILSTAAAYLTEQGRLALISDCTHAEYLGQQALAHGLVCEHVSYSGPTALSVFKLVQQA